MSEIFNEANMRQALGKYIPDGETLEAGIHALSKETKIRGVFGKCVYTEKGLLPDANGRSILVEKEKSSTYDIYLGITQSSLLIVECEKSLYYYNFDDAPEGNGADVGEVTSAIPFEDMGTCFPLSEIQSCELGKGWMGSVKCSVKMKNKSSFKLLLPKLGGVGGGMPHHAEYREAIIARLGGNNK